MVLALDVAKQGRTRWQKRFDILVESAQGQTRDDAETARLRQELERVSTKIKKAQEGKGEQDECDIAEMRDKLLQEWFQSQIAARELSALRSQLLISQKCRLHPVLTPSLGNSGGSVPESEEKKAAERATLMESKTAKTALSAAAKKERKLESTIKRAEMVYADLSF